VLSKGEGLSFSDLIDLGVNLEKVWKKIVRKRRRKDYIPIYNPNLRMAGRLTCHGVWGG